MAGSIALIGISGAGKSTVASLVAESLGYTWADSDRELEQQTGRTIPEIFAEDGEIAFRNIEASVAAELLKQENVVIATGGGLPTTSAGRRALRPSFVIWLKVSPEAAAERLLANPETENRPLLEGSPLEKLRTLAELRAQIYEVVADAIVVVDSKTPEEVAAAVVAAVRAHHDPDPGGSPPAVTEISPPARPVFSPAATVSTPTATYPVFVQRGILASFGEIARSVGLKGRAFLVSDAVIGPLFAEGIMDSLRKSGFDARILLIDGGESEKNLGSVSKIWDWLLGERVERSDFVVCIGGGVVTDMAGFAAATTLRGIPFLHVPTTLLGMADAAIGGKTGIDHPRGKNLIGAFAQPRAVICDPATLDSLPERQLRAGWAEVIKHGFILDFELMEMLELHAGDLDAMKSADLIARGGPGVKAAVVSEDEKESDRRSLLNYGHTVGHAIEAVEQYTGFLHGEAVAIGMRAAGIIAVEMGLLSPEEFERQQRLIRACGLPESAPGLDPDAIIDATKSDKKSSGGVIKWVLLEGLGNATLHADVPDALVRKAVEAVTRQG